MVLVVLGSFHSSRAENSSLKIFIWKTGNMALCNLSRLDLEKIY
jgi:hypothetical protein